MTEHQDEHEIRRKQDRTCHGETGDKEEMAPCPCGGSGKEANENGRKHEFDAIILKSAIRPRRGLFSSGPFSPIAQVPRVSNS